MIFSWLKGRRRRKLLASPVPESWTEPQEALPFVEDLDADERARLVQHARVLEAERHWEGCGGLELTERMRILIALQACRLILNLPHSAYRRVRTILVYPSNFKTHSTDRHDGVGASGLAALKGPVVLSWDSALAGGRRPDDGRNVVYHEFAHKLDGLDGAMDGVPPHGAEGDSWREVLEREYQSLRRRAESGKATLLDTYGATNPAEFFAVATECFFERGRSLRKKHGELYDVLAAFYKQDPAGERE